MNQSILVPADREVKIYKRSEQSENGVTIKSDGTDVTNAIPGHETEAVIYTNSLEVRDIMQGNAFLWSH